ncbi:PspC domain-containing protein [Salibacteraceae bacterium]|nr:PspC domain-containing protein [Salibacteraceae bacterium]MDC1305328.1 PspC domain-containing protein [Salibacteraceae bacterium]
MKRTVQVNLSGQVFTIDEDAYEVLSAYLKRIASLYDRSAGKDEILSDIESRIAELLIERKGESKEVVTIEDVAAVTAIMGNPEQFEDDSMDDTEESYRTNYSSDSSKKRLYRDSDNGIIGGVCSGIAYYFGIDPVWIRLFFGLSFIFFGSGVIFYILLWIIIPEARSASEKLNMKGEPVNIGSIGKTIEKEIGSLGEKISNSGNNFSRTSGRKIERGIDRLAHFLAEIFRGIFKVLGKVLGAIFLMIGTFTIIFMIAGIIGVADVIHFDSNDWNSSMNIYEWGDIVFTSGTWLLSAIVGFILLVGVPFLALAYGGVKLLFPRFKVPYLGASFFGLWFIGLVLSIMTAFSIGQEFSKEEKVVKTVVLSDRGLIADTINLNVGHDPFGISTNRAYYANNDFMMKVDNRRIIVGNVEFDIQQSSYSQVKLEVKKSAQAESNEEAGIRADSIQYNFSMDSSSITFDPFFSYPQMHLLRDQEVRLTLKIPVGQVVYLDPSIKRVMDDIQNVTDMFDPKMVSHYWIMNSEGLTCLDCKEGRDNEDEISIDVDNMSIDVRIK